MTDLKNIWLNNLGGEESNFKETDHTSCRLGQWYSSGIGADEFKDTASYPKLDKPHESVHINANKLAFSCNLISDFL